MKPVYYVDGKFMPADKAVIPVDDLALLRGIGVFDLLRTYDGTPLFLDEHIARLLNSARKIKLNLPWSADKVRQIVLETLARNKLAEANIRIVITGGSSPDFMTPQGNPRLIVLVTPLPQLPAWWYEKGVKVITMASVRHIPDAKSIDYLPAAMALSRAKANGAIEAIYVDDRDNVLEGATSNIFAFRGDTLVTPGKGILSGITRKVVLDLAKEFFQVQVRDLDRRELLEADEVFITGTNKGLVPVVKVDDKVIGTGRPGKRTGKLMQELARRIRPVGDA